MKEGSETFYNGKVEKVKGTINDNVTLYINANNIESTLSQFSYSEIKVITPYISSSVIQNKPATINISYTRELHRELCLIIPSCNQNFIMTNNKHHTNYTSQR